MFSLTSRGLNLTLDRTKFVQDTCCARVFSLNHVSCYKLSIAMSTQELHSNVTNETLAWYLHFSTSKNPAFHDWNFSWINFDFGFEYDSMNIGKSSQLGMHGFGSLHNLTSSCYQNEASWLNTYFVSQKKLTTFPLIHCFGDYLKRSPHPRLMTRT